MKVFSKLFLVTLIGILFYSCKSNDDKKIGLKPIHHQMTFPLRLDIGEQSFYLQDLIHSSVKVDSVFSPELDMELEGIQIKIKPKVDQGHLTYLSLFDQAANRLDVPVFYSNKKKWNYKLEDPNHKFEEVQLVGDFNDWDPSKTPLTFKEGSWQVETFIDPGKYGYQVVVDGKWMLDPNQKETMSNGIGGINSVLEIPGVDEFGKTKIFFETLEDSIKIHSTKPLKSLLVFWDNILIKTNKNAFQIPREANKFDRSFIKVYAADEKARTNELFIPLEKGKVQSSANSNRRSDKHAMRLYFLMVDRFYNGDSTNDYQTPDPDILPIANYFGGDINGVTQKVNEGYFDELNMNAIWLSPIPRNPDSAFGYWDKGGVTSEFSAYHGYWPISFTQIDPRFGDPADLKALVSALHKKDYSILLDFVANHVHENHPVYQANKDKGWATDLYLPDGSLNTEKWDEQRLTTWFDVFLPTLNLEKQEIAEMLSDSALFWLKTYDLDGFRHDATKHIPLNFWRTLTDKVRTYEMEKGKTVYQIGETYGSAALIGSYLSYGMLDAQFDFNMYDALREALVTPSGSFVKVMDRIQQSMENYGYQHLMGNMSGNQDKARIMSFATAEVSTDEDTKLAGWTREIHAQTQKGFQRVAMMHALNFSIPGIPVIYYGDEIGMPGGNDPDNRRMMKFENLSDGEQKLKNTVAKLAEWRKDKLSLQYGSLIPLVVNKDQFAFIRIHADEAVIVAFNKGTSDWETTIELPFKQAKIEERAFSGMAILNEHTIELNIPSNQFQFIKLNQIDYE